MTVQTKQKMLSCYHATSQSHTKKNSVSYEYNTNNLHKLLKSIAHIAIKFNSLKELLRHKHYIKTYYKAHIIICTGK